jgi:hypothetical protein
MSPDARQTIIVRQKPDVVIVSGIFVRRVGDFLREREGMDGLTYPLLPFGDCSPAHACELDNDPSCPDVVPSGFSSRREFLSEKGSVAFSRDETDEDELDDEEEDMEDDDWDETETDEEEGMDDEEDWDDDTDDEEEDWEDIDDDDEDYSHTDELNDDDTDDSDIEDFDESELDDEDSREDMNGD